MPVQGLHFCWFPVLFPVLPAIPGTGWEFFSFYMLFFVAIVFLTPIEKKQDDA